MRSRALRILLLGVFSLWFGVIVPGHERGAIRVPGAKPAAAASDVSCHTPKHCSNCPITGEPADKPAAPESDPASHCAICHLTGVLDAPATIVFVLPQSQLLACLPIPAIRSIADIAVLSIDRGRGPPSLFI